MDDDFERLLAFLDSDRERAGRRYEDIRRRLIKIFARRGRTDPEDLADEVIDRVTRKVPEIAASYVGDPALYFFGVARVMFQEPQPQPSPKPFPPPDPPEIKERNDHCLRICMGNLDQANRDLILEYFQDRGRAKIDHRRELADRLGIPLNVLRMRIHRIKERLAECVLECVSKTEVFVLSA